MNVKRAAALGVAVAGILVLLLLAPANAAVPVPKALPTNLCTHGGGLAGTDLAGPPVGTKLLCRVKDTFKPGAGQGSETSSPASPESAGTGSLPSAAPAVVGAAPAADPGQGSSSAGSGTAAGQKGKDGSKAPPRQGLRVEPTDSRSPLARLPWGPVLLVVAFFVTVRRLARLT